MPLPNRFATSSHPAACLSPSSLLSLQGELHLRRKRSPRRTVRNISLLGGRLTYLHSPCLVCLSARPGVRAWDRNRSGHHHKLLQHPLHQPLNGVQTSR